MEKLKLKLKFKEWEIVIKSLQDIKKYKGDMSKDEVEKCKEIEDKLSIWLASNVTGKSVKAGKVIKKNEL